MTGGIRLRQIKLAMLKQLDRTIQSSCHQSLTEVLQELRLRGILTGADASPDVIFSTVLKTRILSHKEIPEVVRLRQALERLAGGSYGYCTTCGRAIPVERLLEDPTVSWCPRCKPNA